MHRPVHDTAIAEAGPKGPGVAVARDIAAPGLHIIPASTVGSGGWEYDPFRRRKKRIEDDEPPIVPSVPPDIPGAEPAGPLVDLGLIRQRIAGLETQIERHKLDAAVSGELRRKLEALQHRQRLAEDDDWFILLN